MLATVGELSDSHYGRNRDSPYSPPSRLCDQDAARDKQTTVPETPATPAQPVSMAPPQNTSTLTATRKKWSPIKFPPGSPKGHHSPLTKRRPSLIKNPSNVHDRLWPPHPTTPRSSRPSSCPLARRNLRSEVDPWMQGCGPNALDQRYLNDQAPFGINPNVRPTVWYTNNEDESSRNVNAEQNEEELGTAGQTETEEEN